MHRVVFNAARGMRMVVQETAASTGKGASRATTAAGAAALAGVLIAGAAHAQIVGAPNVPGNLRPTVLTAPNGVPLVNIQTPSAAGVSRNVYNQFSVGSNGAILNNSRVNVQTQLGGFVQGNPNLATGPARIILNEVNGGTPSQLRGYIEVGGQRAEVIIANPAGISVDGGGFINASRATLTTGTPQFNAVGGLDSFLVRGGTITIDGAGLDASKTDYAAILARAVQANASIWASELKVVTGANQVSADHTQITPTTGTGAAPTFTLDVAALGGMYAGKITLVGNEAGLGVRNAGNIGASNGNLIVTGAGRLENTGTLEGTRVEISSASDIDNRGGTIRQTSSVGLGITAPVLSNTNSGIIGIEPAPAPIAGTEGSTSNGSDTGTSGTASPSVSPTGTSSGTGSGSSNAASPAPAPFVPTSPGTITAAATILNDGGRIYTGGPIALQTPQINNAGGTLSVASMAVTGPNFSNAGGTLNVSQSFGANVGTFDNTGGKLNAGSLTIATSGDLINTDGVLTSASDANLTVGGRAENTRGTISATGVLTANVVGATTNNGGTLTSNQTLSLNTGSLENTGGSVQSAQAGVQLGVANALTNGSGGSISAATDLSIQTGSLTNGGSLRGSNDANIAVGGALTNDGSVTAGRNTTITAGSVHSGTSSVLGAGAQGDGKLGGVGDLRVTSSGALVANGSNIAAGNAALQGASIDLSTSQTSAINIAVTATQGNVTTSNATVVTPGTLSITANSHAAQTLVNDAGKLNASQLQIDASNLANTNKGEIVQTGTGATTIATSGTLNNDGGRIASNGQDLTLQGMAITSNVGKIEHAGPGTLTITGGSFNGADGQITANNALVVAVSGAFNQDGGKATTSAKQISIDAGSLSNRGGQIVQTGSDATRITVVGAIDNTSGTIASNGNTTIATGSLTNQGGSVRAAETSSLGLTVGGLLDNSNKGSIGAGGNTTATAGSLNNDAGSVTAVGDLSATIGGAAMNVGGTLAANGSTTLLVDGMLDNSGGTAAAVKGNLSVTTSGATTNTGGTLQAGANVALTNGGLINRGGTVFGESLSVDTHKNALDNSKQGTLAAATTVDIKSGALNNDTGLIQSNGGAMTIDTDGQKLTNSNAANYTTKQGGITSADTLTLKNVGDVDNAAGFIGAKNALNADTRLFTNTGNGQVIGQSAVVINTNGARYDNGGGQTLAVGNLDINAGSIANTSGLVRSAATTTLNAGSIGNKDTLGANQGIEGKSVAIGTGELDNTSGAIRADVDTTITSGGTVTNTNGLISAGNELSIRDPNRANPGAKTLNLVNTNGTLVADKSLKIDAATFSGDGKAVSGQDLSLALTQNVTNNGEVAANGNLSYTTTGNFTNNGKLLAGQTLTVGGNNVDNSANAEMSGTNTTINTSGTLTNRGLIDSKNDTQINAGTGTLKNIGTGRIYGNAISIATGTLENDAETVGGLTKAGTIAARSTLNIGATTITNREHALIFSGGMGAGAMSIGGSLDANRKATAQGSVLNNLSADIESLGDMSISMANVNNRDVHIQRGPQTVTFGLQIGIAPNTPLGSGIGRTTTYRMDEVTLDAANGLVFLQKTGELVGMGGYGVWNNLITTTEDTAINIDPAHLVAGGSMSVNGRLYNENSQVLAGGTITSTEYVSSQLSGTRTVTGSATVVNNEGQSQTPIPIPIITAPETITLGAYKYQENINATTGYDAGSAPVGSAAGSAGAAGGTNGGNRPDTIVQVTANVGAVIKTSGSAAGSADAAAGAGDTDASQTVPMVVRTSGPNTRIPTASLFSIRAGGGYLIETDPRFANYRNWLSSDYLLNSLGLDPNNILKRLGDGFYEQKLIREQVAQLTGYRYLDGYSNDDDQYAALMDAGATFAKQYGLRPGIALSAAQMAQLTSDIVWLVEQTVTLPDGSTQRVLVPQVYVRVRPGDIDGSGALLSADATVIKSSGDVVNTGTIAGRSLVSITADNVNNLDGGRIAGGSVGINARNNINNIGASITARDAAVLTAGGDINVETTTRSRGTSTGIDRVAGVYVTDPGGTLIASAGHDVNLIGAALVSAGSAAVGAGRNINLGTVSEGHTLVFNAPGAAGISTKSREVGSVIQGQDSVRMVAGHDVNVRASAVQSVNGALIVTAGNDINVTSGEATRNSASATQTSSKNLFRKSSSSTADTSATTEVLSSSLSGKSVALVANNDINLQAAQLRSADAMSLSAGRDINLTTANQTDLELHAAQSKTSGTAFGMGLAAATFMGDVTAVAIAGNKKSSNHADASISTQAIGTSISAGRLQTLSGRDTTLKAATVVADSDIIMMAGRNLTIESAQNQRISSRYDANSKSGMVGEWYNPAIGNVKGSQANAEIRTTQQASQVASLAGNVTMIAGNEYRQTASSIMAAGQAGPELGGNVNILAKNALINEAYNTTQSISLDKSSSTIVGGSANFMGVGTDTLKGGSSTIKAMGDIGGDGRMQALGAINLAMSGKQAYDAVQAIGGTGPLSYGVSVNVSRNSSQSTSFTNTSAAVGSSVVGANNVNIVATGGSKDSNIRAVGSTIAAGNTVNMAADNDVTLEASKNTSVTVGQNSSRGANVGVTFGAGAQNGFSIQLGVQSGKGSNNQNDTTYNATQVSGGKAVNVSTGRNLTLDGATIEGNRVTADVGGDLKITTLQDVSVGQSRQSSGGFGVSLCIPPICYGAVASVSGSAAGAKADGIFISPAVQSGIKAGDGGFDVKVAGNTDLKGAVIESTQAAIDGKKNNFSTGGTLTMTDLQNVSQSSGSSYSVSGGLSVGYTTAPTAATETAPARDMTASWTGPSNRPSGAAGVGSYSGNNQASVTKSGISGIAGDQSVRTGDNSSAGTLIKDWNTQTIIKDVQAQAQLSAQFGQNASKAVGDYANGKLKEANDLYNLAAAETDPTKKAALYSQADQLENDWKEGGAYRIAAHAAVGGLTGGAGGAAGAAASSVAIPAIGEQIANLDMPVPVKQALVMAMGTAIGAATGGAAGAAGAFNETSNNYLTATDLRNRQQKLEGCRARKDPACEVDVLRAYDLKSANNTGELKGSSLIEKMGLESVRAGLEQLLSDPTTSEETKAQARKSIKEINTAINVIDRAPVIKEALQLGLMAADIYTLGELTAARLLTTSIVKETVLARTGKSLSDDAAERIAGNFYADNAAATAAKNPLLVDSIPRNGNRLVLDQGMAPTCGHNSCGMVLDTLGNSVDVAKLIEKVPPGDLGIFPKQVEALMKAEGVDAVALGRRNVDDLARYTADGVPVVVRIVDKTGGTDFSHFVVVDGVTTRNGVRVVAIRDPQGKQYFSQQYFSPAGTFQTNFTGDVILPKPKKP
ncbi:hemagglutinin repeat-containing protein [Variovorax guangxiensis]|uniref:two-partner secretion domain-containing protein n=1 Tax=Variovorax guangxiensis TaxID=1775474 RepID=UPI0023E83A27|nr:hemagglutinin repeat-containing protein [Variovorax guangxiensis]